MRWKLWQAAAAMPTCMFGSGICARADKCAPFCHCLQGIWISYVVVIIAYYGTAICGYAAFGATVSSGGRNEWQAGRGWDTAGGTGLPAVADAGVLQQRAVRLLDFTYTASKPHLLTSFWLPLTCALFRRAAQH